MECSGSVSKVFNNLLIIIFLFISCSISLTAQERTISGYVSHSITGDPLPGVNVFIEGTSLGTTTNNSGQYSLEVPQVNENILFSFLGMRTAIEEINGRTVIDLQMEPDVIGLDEVVVTAMGQTREKRSLGYSVQELSGGEIETAREKNMLNSLQGRLAGVQITNSSGSVSTGSRILIRGNSTLRENNQPLFVVDGIPVLNNYDNLDRWGGVDYGNTAMDLNPSDIENISILKGANAAALYGSRALNGVVLITTKKGKLQPGLDRGVEVSFESNFMWEKLLILPEFQDSYGQGISGMFEYVDGKGGNWLDGWDVSWGPPLDYIVKEEDIQPEGRLEWTNWYGIPQTVGQTLVLPQFDSPYDPVTDVRTPTPWVSHPDNVKEVFETGLTANHTLSISGAGRDASFRLSIGDQRVKGIIPNTDLVKNNVSLAGGLKVSKRLKIEGTATYINNRSDNIMSGGYQSANILQSLGMYFGRQVDTKILREKWNTTDPKTGQPFNWIHHYHDNPYFTLNKHLNTRNRSRFIGTVNLEYQIIPSLSISGVIGTDWYTERRKEVRAMGSVIIENNTDWNRGRFDSYLYTVHEFTARAQLNFNKTFGEFNLLATTGAEFSRIGFFADATHVNALIVPDLYSVSNAAVPATSDMQEENRELQGVFGMVNLGFKNYLYLDLTARNDWSSTLPLNNNSYFYPSASIGFILTEVLKMPTNILSFLKFRASYAEVGGSAAAYQLNGKFKSFDLFRGNPALTYTDTRPPENLKPQNKRSVEFGTDMRFASNRFGFDLTWYKENTINQIMNIDIPGTTGFNRQTINAGNLQNQGWELTLNATPVRTSSLTWDITFNWSRNVNTVVALHEDINQIYLYPGPWGKVNVYARVGEPYGQMYGKDMVREHAKVYYSDGSATIRDHIEYSGRPLVDTMGDYQRSVYESPLGNIMPDWFGGISNRLNFRNFNFSFLVDFRKGGDQFSLTHDFGRVAGILEETARFNANGKNIRDPVADGGGLLIGDAVYGEVNADGSIKLTDQYGNEVDEPVVNETYVEAQDFYLNYWAPASLSVFDASFVKLREVVFGYTFFDVAPWLTEIRLSLVGRNLWLIYSNIPGIDPENVYSAGNTIGINSNPIPSTRSLGFNVKINF